jgi:hypothetical protein
MNELLLIIARHYKNHAAGWSCYEYHALQEDFEGSKSIEFLINRKYLARYSITNCDRGFGYSGGVCLAIGPRFFSPFQFWSHDASQRFRLDTEPDDIVFNLKLLDEFLGYKHLPPL